jgi:hypothetical protein
VLLMDVSFLPFAASVPTKSFRDGEGERVAVVVFWHLRVERPPPGRLRDRGRRPRRGLLWLRQPITSPASTRP